MNISELAKKLKAMADCETGNENERENARQKLKELLEKHNLTEDSLTGNEKKEHFFIFYEKRERMIFRQVAYKILDAIEGIKVYKKEALKSIRSKKDRLKLEHTYIVYCTKVQAIEMEFLTSFFYNLYLKEEDFLFSSFIQKHKIFGKTEKGDNISYEDLKKMIAMMAGMYEATPLKQIESKHYA
jgi:hypothetical protein